MIEAGAAHAGALAAVHQAAFPEEPWDAASFVTLLGQPGVVGLLDERGGILLLRVAADEAEILTLGVVARRRGLGRDLLTAGLARARAMGVVRVFLEVAAGNAAALGLYGAFGFAPVGRRVGYYAGGEDALVLALTL